MGKRYRSEPLGKHHDRTDFCCGVEALDRYLREQAGQDQRRNVAAPYVLIDTETGDIVGYYTLSMATILPKNLPVELARQLPRYDVLPAARIGRLAVDHCYRGRGIGTRLLMDALARCLESSKDVAAMAVIVDAKDDAAQAFYEHHAFVRFVEGEPRCLYLPIKTIAQIPFDETL